MLHSSIPLGRYFGVEVRMHMAFPLLLLLSIGYSLFIHGTPSRGVALWLALCFAVLVREVARSIAATYAGLKLRGVLLLPIGGVMAFALNDGPQPESSSTWVATTGPVANFGTGLLLLGLAYSFDPHVSLYVQPWITTTHILRSVIWLQFVLGAVSLLPTTTLPTRQVVRARTDSPTPKGKPRREPPVLGYGTATAVGLILAGILLPNFGFLIGLGACLLMYVFIIKATSQPETEGETILVREVMITEYSLLLSSETLRGALDRTVHTVHDVFPVVRGNQLVGSIARHSISEHLAADGDSYLQGAMNKNLQIAAPDELLVDVLRRASHLTSSEFIPVADDGTLVGILSPQNLARAVQQVKLTRPLKQKREPAE